MVLKVYKIAEIVQGKVRIITDSPKFKAGVVEVALTNLEPVSDPEPGAKWTLDIEIASGVNTRQVQVDLPPVIPKSHDANSPVLIPHPNGWWGIAYYQDRLFMTERPPATASEREEFTLRVKKATYDERAELSRLRAAVANLEAAIEYERSGPRRNAIPEDVKLIVWSRDGGACVRCGSKRDLQFDHIIPVAKGGGNSEANIQILCQTCNLAKSGDIAVS